MNEPALRDIERWKDKIEVRLDNRQVFFLFFGSALVACLLFVLGVIVGKRLESRGRAEAPEIEDPLALLDRVAATPATAASDGLTFPKLLNGSKSKVASEGRKPSVPGPVPTASASPSPATPMKLAAAAPAAPKPTAQPVTEPAPSPKPADKPAAPKMAAPAAKPPAVSAPVTPPKPAATVAPSAAPKPAATNGTKTAAPAKGAFTLQLSSFQDRAEADAFAKRFPGEPTFVVTSEIPGKGTWYRVRVGSFGSAKEAADAKAAFERKHNVIAYVAGR